MSSPSNWWYGVLAFPLVAVTALLTRFATRRFITVSAADGDPNVAVALASFVLSVLAQWVGVFVALVVLVCLVLDVRALRRVGDGGEGGTDDGDGTGDGDGTDDGTGDDGGWSPTWAWTLAGVAHLVGALFAPALAVSVPSLSYYVYRRYEGGTRAV
ncbi:hypothetical protein SAMN04487947_0283 [Halogeometricum rufum]|uniref:Uncharacterized protein n=1 Tax=Halogeometricum rufum TaxID=553469 RepID=A0A1I6FZ42_9EURY|nr:hypothetical protein [Halogeometricum rufum]SFR35209.1 hypothetical protein SAMN04487947_0283 [Halogeometricum rufum]